MSAPRELWIRRDEFEFTREATDDPKVGGDARYLRSDIAEREIHLAALREVREMIERKIQSFPVQTYNLLDAGKIVGMRGDVDDIKDMIAKEQAR